MNNRQTKKRRHDDDADDDYGRGIATVMTTNDGPKEAKLDDIIYSFGGEEAICLSGSNTPFHVLRAYKELCDLRHKHGDVIENDSSHQNDLTTISSINNECFIFLQALLSKWNVSRSGSLNKSFGGRHSIRDDGVVINLVVTTPHVSHNFFQQKWSNLVNRVCKLVVKNVKTKKKVLCNCSDDNHPINETVMLITPILKKRDNKTVDFCVTWYVNCSYVN